MASSLAAVGLGSARARIWRVEKNEDLACARLGTGTPGTSA